MKNEMVILRLPPDLLASLRMLAREAGVTPGQYLRDYVALRSAERTAPHPVPKPGNTATAMLRDAIEDILDSATSWERLQASLVAQGFALRLKGLRLVLDAWPSGEEVCKASDLGFSYAALIDRLGPGEPPAPVAEQVLDAAS